MNNETKPIDADEALGYEVAEILHLKPNKDGRFDTTWGSKTAKGLGLSIKRLVQAIESQS